MTDPQTEMNVAIAVLAARLRGHADAVVAQALLDNDHAAMIRAMDALTEAKNILDEAVRTGRRDLCTRCGRPFPDHQVAFHNRPPDAQLARFGFATEGIYCR